MLQENEEIVNNQKLSNGLGILFAVMVAAHVGMSFLISLLVNKGIKISMSVQLMASELTIFIPSVIYILKKNLSFKDDLGFRPIKPGTVFMTLLAGALLYPFITFVNLISQLFVPNTALEMSDALLTLEPGILLLIGGFVGPFCEEFAFRAILNNGMKKVTSILIAGLSSGLLFGMLHMNVNQFCYAFAMGAAFAFLNEVSNSVFGSIILHCAYNTMNLMAIIVETKLMKVTGTDAFSQAEVIRNSDIMYYAIGFFFIAAVIGLAILIPVVGWIAKHEGNSEVFGKFLKKPADSARVLVTWGMLIGIAICVVMIIVK